MCLPQQKVQHSDTDTDTDTTNLQILRHTGIGEWWVGGGSRVRAVVSCACHRT